ncbi:hypothetical protein [Amycolatopsis sp. NPDC004625]|uniref:hypothetical protein n=1 Tax=Amycolatopsis sp. NPDC004625 TaxID=3154670 RepID=UPI0033AC9511
MDIMAPKELRWPSEADLLAAEVPEFALLGRVLIGLRRLSFSEAPPRSTGAPMSRETTRLVDTLLATQVRISLLVHRIQDRTVTTDEQRDFADNLDELRDILQSHAADVDAGIVLTPHDLLLAERQL